MDELNQETSQSQETPASTVDTSAGTQELTPQEIIDLDKVEKFRFSGREWTQKDLTSGVMMQSDYTRKTQAIAEERKYMDNLDHDLERIKSNPSLAAEFKSVYPEKYHAYLKYVINEQAANPAAQTNGVDQSLMEELAEMKKWRSELESQKVSAVEAELDAKFKVLGEKYPLADEETVLNRAQALLKQKSSNGDAQSISEKEWDVLWRSTNERSQKRAEAFYAAQVNKQKQANNAGQDTPSGGGLPGRAPVQPRRIKDVAQHVLAELDNS